MKEEERREMIEPAPAEEAVQEMPTREDELKNLILEEWRAIYQLVKPESSSEIELHVGSLVCLHRELVELRLRQPQKIRA